MKYYFKSFTIQWPTILHLLPAIAHVPHSQSLKQ